jgi:hypothetical protein
MNRYIYCCSITTDSVTIDLVVRSNLAQGEVYLIQHYVIKFVSEVWQVGGTPVSSTIKTDHHNIHVVVYNVIAPQCHLT